MLGKLREAARRAVVAARIAGPGKTLRAEFVNAHIGFFAQMNFCLYVARLAERRGKAVRIVLSSENYRDPAKGENWFHYFFAEKGEGAGGAADGAIRISDNSQLPRQAGGLDLAEANRVFWNAFELRADIQAAVVEAVQRLDIDHRTLGLHFRATDKSSEAQLVPADVAITKVRALVAQLQPRNLFVSTDDARFLALIAEGGVGVPVVSLDDSARSDSDTPVHLGGLKQGNYALGRDALLNALILAKCGWLVRTTSFLSAWSVVFTPTIPVFMLNQPHAGKLWFPEKEILPQAVML